MVEVDPIPIIISLAGPIGVAVVIGWYKKVNKSADGTLTGTIKLEHVQSEQLDMKAEMNKGFDRIEVYMKERDRLQAEALNKVWDKMSEVNTTVKLNTYRIESLERERIRYYKDDREGKGAV